MKDLIDIASFCKSKIADEIVNDHGYGARIDFEWWDMNRSMSEKQRARLYIFPDGMTKLVMKTGKKEKP